MRRCQVRRAPSHRVAMPPSAGAYRGAPHRATPFNRMKPHKEDGMLACARLKIASLGLAVMLALCLRPDAPALAQAPNLPDGVKALLAPAKAEGATAMLYGADVDPIQAAALSKAMGDFYGASFDIRFVSTLHPQK